MLPNRFCLRQPRGYIHRKREDLVGIDLTRLAGIIITLLGKLTKAHFVSI